MLDCWVLEWVLLGWCSVLVGPGGVVVNWLAVDKREVTRGKVVDREREVSYYRSFIVTTGFILKTQGATQGWTSFDYCDRHTSSVSCALHSNPNSVTVLDVEDCRCLLGLWYLSKVYLWVARLCFSLLHVAWFLESKREWGGKGNAQVENMGQVSTGPSLPTVVDLMMEKDKLSSLEDTIVPESFPPLSTRLTTAGNACSIDGLDAMLENVWVKLHGVPVMAFSEDGLSSIATKLGTPLMLDSYTSDMCMQSWGRSSYARVMIEIRADVELKDNIIVAMPKITREGHYTCNVRVEFEWKPPRCSSCKVFGHIHEECSKNT
ncbi:copia protein [Tanacetum coccineum]